MVLILCQGRPDPHAQLFQPFSQFIPVGLSSHTMLAVWAVESQEGQYVTDPTSQAHNSLCQPHSEP
jgi:hypothetical protein